MEAGPNRVLVLIVTEKCDIACRYCFYTTGHQKRSPKKFDVSMCEEAARKLRALDFSAVVLTGGDPLNRIEKSTTFQIVEGLHRTGLKVIMNTSGAFLDEEDCTRLVTLNPHRIDFSLDSHIAQVHNHLRGRYDDTISAIKTLLGMSYKSIVVTIVVTSQNAAHLSNTIDFLKDMGITEVRVQPGYIPSDAKFQRSLELELEDATLKEMHKALSRLASRWNAQEYHAWWMSHFYTGESTGFVANVAKPRACQMGKNIFVSDAAGNLSPCFHRGDIPIGNLFTSSETDLRDAISCNPLSGVPVPSCIGKHCLSLFDNPDCWGQTHAC